MFNLFKLVRFFFSTEYDIQQKLLMAHLSTGPQNPEKNEQIAQNVVMFRHGSGTGGSVSDVFLRGAQSVGAKAEE